MDGAFEVLPDRLTPVLHAERRYADRDLPRHAISRRQ